jgi:dTDP-4-dehydrorhamnose reductase
MRIAVTGAAGLLGRELIQTLNCVHVVLPLTRSDADITLRSAIFRRIAELQPDLVIHAAAIRDLDLCEKQPDFARAVNIEGTRNTLQATAACAADFAFISSDAVFSGTRSLPYGEDDIARPCSVYGQTKLTAEAIVSQWPRHFIFRLSVLFGNGTPNVIETILRTVASGRQYAAATDQIGSATYIPDAARVIEGVIDRRAYGLFHVCNPGEYSRFDLASLAVSIAGLPGSRVVGRRRDEFDGAATRSEYCAMRMDRLPEVGIQLPQSVESALGHYVRAFVL